MVSLKDIGHCCFLLSPHSLHVSFFLISFLHKWPIIRHLPQRQKTEIAFHRPRSSCANDLNIDTQVAVLLDVCRYIVSAGAG